MNKSWIGLLGSVALAAVITGCHRGSSAEHPGPTSTEHPQATPSAGASQRSELEGHELAQAVRAYIDAQASRDNGHFDVYDPLAGKMLRLTLVQVHEDRLAALGRDAYFACADFKSNRGTVYDVDVFMKQTPNGLEATDTAIHKVDGHPRYYWIEERGHWVKRSSVSWWDRLLGRARECE
jgi:hypothetical protein